MNTKEASEKWGCNENIVREYCKSGIIPVAYKERFKWVIPDDIQELPPVSAKKAVYLMKCIEENTLPGSIMKDTVHWKKLQKSVEYPSWEKN